MREIDKSDGGGEIVLMSIVLRVAGAKNVLRFMASQRQGGYGNYFVNYAIRQAEIDENLAILLQKEQTIKWRPIGMFYRRYQIYRMFTGDCTADTAMLAEGGIDRIN